jgi:hypothetical protein
MNFKPETDGLANLIAAMKNHPEARLLSSIRIRFFEPKGGISPMVACARQV